MSGKVEPNPANDRLYAAAYRAMRAIMRGDGEVLSAEDMIGRAVQLVVLADAVRAEDGEWTHAEVLELAAECGERTSREPSEQERTAAVGRLLAAAASWGDAGARGPEGEAGS